MNKLNWTYDIETLPNFFCAVFKNGNDIRIFEISARRNDYEVLYMFLRTEVNSLRGYNNLNFDSQIIEYLWSVERTAEELSKYASFVIEQEYPPVREKELKIPNIDIFRILHLDNKNRMVGLKWCQFMIDWHNIEDMPFYRAVESNQEADEIIQYCINDVKSTEALFEKYKQELELRVALTLKYNINFINASNSKIGSDLCLNLYCEKTGFDKYNIKNLRTYRDSIIFNDIIFPYIKFESAEFTELLNWFKNQKINLKDPDLKFEKSFVYKGFQFDYGLGGIHGSISKQIVTVADDEIIIDADVASLYPSIAVVNGLYPEHLGPEFSEVYGNDIVAVRLAEKAKPDGNKAIIAGLKEAANSVYGC